MIENLIVGSGFGAIAAGMALRERGAPFEVLDVGDDLEQATQRDVSLLAEQEPSAWDTALQQKLFPAPSTSAKGVERRNLFGSDFPYRVPEYLRVTLEHCNTEFSHALGGFGNVWGAAMLPYSDHTLRDWPIERSDLSDSYRNVLRYVALSGERDALETNFPLNTDRLGQIARSKQIESLLGAFNHRRGHLDRLGVEFGRARVAVDSGAGESGCRYCGRCLEGCVYGSIFNPRLSWPQLNSPMPVVHRGTYALEFEEQSDCVSLTTIDTATGSPRTWRARRIFLGTGHFGTTRLIARSLKLFRIPIKIRDSQYFFFPLLSYLGQEEEERFALAEMFVEILNRKVSDHYVHFQLYGMNRIFKGTLESMLPKVIPLGPIRRRFFMFQGYLDSHDSGHLELELTGSGEKHDEITVRGVDNPSAITVAKRAQALLRKALLGFGIIPPIYLQLVPPGRSFHTGGSFPIGQDHAVFSSDALGRPAGLKRVHIVDSASFPSIPSSTIAYTIMANADRIVRACAT